MKSKGLRNGFLILIGILFLCSLFLFSNNAAAAVDICLVSPIGGEMYRTGETMTIHWKAENDPVCAWSIQFYYKWGGDSYEHYIGSVYYQPEGVYSWTLPYVADKSFLQIVAKMTTDGGGICGDSVSTYSMTIWPASTERTINLITPQPNSCDNNELVLGAGDTYEITWDLSGCEWNSLNVNIYYATSFSLPEGYNWEKITDFGVPCTNRTYTWTVPDVDTSNAKIKLEWPGPLPEMTVTHIHPFTITPDPVNHCPEADAGDDQTVNEHEVVTLDATGSFDPEGDDWDSYWEVINPGGFYESQVTISDPYNKVTSFTAPNVPVEIQLDFRLTITAEEPCNGSPDEDIVSITVRPVSPYISYFTPLEGWFKTPVTIFGENLGGSKAYLEDTEVSAGYIPLDSDDEFTFFTPDLSLDSYSIKVGLETAFIEFNLIDVPYQWNWGFQFKNPGSYNLFWSDYINCFGRDAVTWELTCCEWDGIFCERACHNPIAQAIFDGYIETMTQAGSCWGMSVGSLNFLYGNYTLPFGGYDEVRDLIWNNAHPDVGITREIRQLVISQMSAEVIAYLLDHLGDAPSDHLARVMEDTEQWRDKSHPDYVPGVISIQHIIPGGSLGIDSFEGHALVPDHVEEISPGEFRIYVYDSNREERSTSLDNTNPVEYADITDINTYPYITVNTSGSVEEWSFNMGSEIWEANSGYNITVAGEHMEFDIPFYGLYYFPANIAVRDHYTFPTSLRGLGMILSGSADCGISENDGDLLGYDATGKLNFEIAGAMPIVPVTGGSFPDKEFYWLPDQEYSVDIYGKKADGEYDWKAINGNTLFALNSSKLNPGQKDDLVLERGNKSLRLSTTEPLKEFSVEMVKTFTQNGNTYQRIFEVIDTQTDNTGSAWFRVTPDLNALVYENISNLKPVFIIRFVQTLLGPQPEPPDNQTPANIKDQTLIIQNLTLQEGQILKLTPENWENLAQSHVDYQYYKSGTLPDSAGDVNYDGDIDGLDLVVFARSYDTSQFEADLDMNGEINSADLKMFASRFGEVAGL